MLQSLRFVAAGAADLKMGHLLNIEETYNATCGQHTFRWVYPIQHTTHDLTATPAYEAGELTGFRVARGLTAASSRRMPPMLGDDCSREAGQPAGSKVDAICFESSTTSWGLRMRSGNASHYVELRREPSPPRPEPPSKYSPPDCPVPA
ncbi:hypothetical protein [Actinoplanes solisilvae]|uniref:hypothetical protein n=1 Tax=Actinoplanes solisilvae TaxID=2486853 RepID=UPI000FDB1A43|nr:hypothetical protein [Actinoplanes solisilvae]